MINKNIIFSFILKLLMELLFFCIIDNIFIGNPYLIIHTYLTMQLIKNINKQVK